MTLISFLLLTVIALSIGYAIFQLTNFKDGEIIVAPVNGFLLGFHYNKEENENENQYTLQFSLFLVIITFNWYK